MQFYTKFQSPQNLFTNIRKIPRIYQHAMPHNGEIGEEWNQDGYYNILNKDYDPTFMTIIAIIFALGNNPNPTPETLKYLKEKSKTYLLISLILHTVILLPLTFLIALARDVIDIAIKPFVIALNLALDAAQLAIEAVTLALQLVAFCIEKVIVNPIAFVFNKLFSKANNEEEGPGAGAGAGKPAVPAQEAPAQEAPAQEAPAQEAAADAANDDAEELLEAKVVPVPSKKKGWFSR